MLLGGSIFFFYVHGHPEEEYRQSRRVSGARVEEINLPYTITHGRISAEPTDARHTVLQRT